MERKLRMKNEELRMMNDFMKMTETGGVNVRVVMFR